MKIIRTKKYVKKLAQYNPYAVDFTTERAKAKRMDTDSLFGALKDAIEASQVSVNEEKYYDQVSVYRQELTSRGIHISQQDKKLETVQSLHTTPQSRKELVDKTRGAWSDLSPEQSKQIMNENRFDFNNQ